MKMDIKRMLALALAVLMSLTLVACGSDGNDTTTTTTAGDATVTTTVANDTATTTDAGTDATTTVGGQAATTTKKDNTVTTTKPQAAGGNLTWAQVKAKMPKDLGKEIVFFNWNPMNSVSGAVDAISAFKKETGINVKWEVGAYDEYITKIVSRVATNTSPDIVRMRDTDISLIKQLMPLSDLGYDFSDKAWNQTLMNEYKVNGKQYGMILNDTPYYQAHVMYYNRSLINKYKLEDPYDLWKEGKWTWNKCMEMCEEFLEQAGDNYDGLTMADFCEYAHCLGVPMIVYDAATSQYVSNLSDNRTVKAWQFVSNNLKKGNLNEVNWDLAGFNAGLNLFANNALISARSSHFHYVDLKKNGELGTVPLPTVNGQKDYYVPLMENEAYAVPKGAPNAKAVPYFLRYFLDANHYDMDSFYCDEQAREVADWCKKQNYVISLERIIYADQYGSSVYNISYRLRQTDAAQIKTSIDMSVPLVSQVVKDGNAAIKALG